MKDTTNLVDLSGQISLEMLEEHLGTQVFIHSSEKKNRQSIMKEGLGASNNRVITSGIYTFEDGGAQQMFHHSQYDYYHIRLKKGARILFTNSDRPMDYVIGNFESPFRAEWDRIVEETGIGGQEDILKIFGRGDAWFDWKAKFHRGVEKYLKEKGYAGIQEGGQFTITDLDQIESIKLDNNTPVAVNKDKKF